MSAGQGMPLTLREPERGDLPAAAAVFQAIAPLYADILPGAFEAYANRLERRDVRADYTPYLICRDGQVVGFLGATRLRSDVVYLVALYLLPAVHRQGLGSEAIRRLLDLDAYRGARTLVVQAHDGAAWAIAFYERLGLGGREEEGSHRGLRRGAPRLLRPAGFGAAS